MEYQLSPHQLQGIRLWMEEHREQMVADIKRLLRIPSVSRKENDTPPYGQHCRRALEEMLAIGREHGFTTENYDYQCGALWLTQNPHKKTIGLWGHLDVVPEGEDWQWWAPCCLENRGR